MKLRELMTVMLCLSATGLMTSLPLQAQERPYTVTNGNQLDADSYKGFKLYRNWCARCHGTYGQGLAGPNLAQSLNKISRDEFMTTVADGKTGTIGSMPAWKANPGVMEGREYIYSYLKARADGAIGEVKPEKAK
ncbi:c-type cytochrome [Methylophaga sp. OBS4]|uniref:c-type cytochrome n=1 Tax=Methylophaga sp. OBS4 TaxID=2991935 RepID=UPI00225690E3|nr:cytochrome c [Methylophaga sp. OBS4]MCX4186331.1 cytochrome c [Methylophaga sp. OBS4]